MRETGMAVSVNMTVIRASQIDQVFRCKSSSAKYSTIRCLLQSNGIVIRLKTHEAQTAPAEKREEAKAWVVTVVPILTQPNCHQDWIMNMDQTPVPFTMTPKTTLNEQGSRTVNVRSSTGITMWLTLAVFVTESGKKLTPYIIFNAKLNGCIMMEFSKVNSGYPENAHLTVKDNAWMDEQCCFEWVEKCVKPWAESAPVGIIPLLFLDSYRCHQQASVVNSIAELGVEVQFIPGGCTGLCQAVDVGVNKPLKNRMCQMWEEYMLEEGLQQLKTCPSSQQKMVHWCIDALQDLPEDLVKNAWRHGEYSWFSGENEVQLEMTMEPMEELDFEENVNV